MTHANVISPHTNTLFSSVKNLFISPPLKSLSAANVAISDLASTSFSRSDVSFPWNYSRLADSMKESVRSRFMLYYQYVTPSLKPGYSLMASHALSIDTAAAVVHLPSPNTTSGVRQSM
jgi:hypothetical protein